MAKKVVSIGNRAIATQHPTYIALAPIWTLLRDAREGTGGFLSGHNLVAHPREWQDYDSPNPSKPTKKLKARRALACYENFPDTIIEAFTSALFREQAVRQVGDNQGESAIDEWWEDVDGVGTHVDDFWAQAWDLAGTYGYVYLYLDRPATTAATAADTPKPFVRVYTPLDVPDWLTDDVGNLIGVKFLEGVPRASFDQPADNTQKRYRVVTDTEWVLYDYNGAILERGAHAIGTLPVVVLFSKRRKSDRHVGASVLGDPKLYQDVYNLTSEVRELLRNQTFGLLNIPLGTGDQAITVEQAIDALGKQRGTDNVVFSGLAAQFIQPDAANVTVYHEEISRRLRTIYRLVSLSWESDTKDAEAEGSLTLKREEMNQRLSKFADELERADYALADLFYRAEYGADAGSRRLEQDQLTIKYPDTFELTPFEELAAQLQSAQSIGLPSLFLKEARKRAYKKFPGMADLSNEQQDAIDKAIDAAPDDLTPQEQADQRMNMVMEGMKKGVVKPPKPALPKEPAA
jgi:hypothetical protein